MDYPKNVPGVGLVGGKFVDENQATGQQGSLIPSAWGNAVTDELLNLLAAAGVEPKEAVLNQIATALFRSPTELLRGMPQIASVLEAQAQLSGEKMLSPKGLGDAFKGANQMLASPGFQRLPGGLILQWGSFGVLSSTADTTVTFPLAFPNVVFAFLVTQAYSTGSGNVAYCAGVPISKTQAVARGISSSYGAFWFALGN